MIQAGKRLSPFLGPVSNINRATQLFGTQPMKAADKYFAGFLESQNCGVP